MVFCTGSVPSPFLPGHTNSEKALSSMCDLTSLLRYFPTLKNLRRIVLFTLTVSYNSFTIWTDFPSLVLNEGKKP